MEINSSGIAIPNSKYPPIAPADGVTLFADEYGAKWIDPNGEVYKMGWMKGHQFFIPYDRFVKKSGGGTLTTPTMPPPTASPFNTYTYMNPAALNDETALTVNFMSGDYVMTLLYVRSSAGAGNVDISIGGSSIGSIVPYNASTVHNARTEIEFTLSTGGSKEILFTADTIGTGSAYQFIAIGVMFKWQG